MERGDRCDSCGKSARSGVAARIDPRLAAALHEIDRLPTNAPFSARAQELGRAGGLSIGQLNRMCVRALGQTLYAYWDERRLERARRQLGQTPTPIKEIAYGLGFTQLSHFSAWFRRATGKSPRAYRKANDRVSPTPADPS